VDLDDEYDTPEEERIKPKPMHPPRREF
jgi:hypothetical protein